MPVFTWTGLVSQCTFVIFELKIVHLPVCCLFLVSSNIIIVCPVFKPEELRQALMPTLEALYKQDPESLPFRQPVDPMLLGIPVSIHTYILMKILQDTHKKY